VKSVGTRERKPTYDPQDKKYRNEFEGEQGDHGFESEAPNY
jgi:hypothetical protein